MGIKYSSRNAKTFNFARKIFQWIVAKVVLVPIKCKYNVLKPIGLENIDKSKKYVVASNHISGFDPFFVASQTHCILSYMAKKELFETFFSMLLMDWCGAFAVDRDNVDVSTIKTALSIKKTSWHLGIFPQGTRTNSKILEATKGFAAIAKKMGREILPVAIIKNENQNGKSDLYVKIAPAISVNDDVDTIYENWCKAICELAGMEMPETAEKVMESV